MVERLLAAMSVVLVLGACGSDVVMDDLSDLDEITEEQPAPSRQGQPDSAGSAVSVLRLDAADYETGITEEGVIWSCIFFPDGEKFCK